MSDKDRPERSETDRLGSERERSGSERERSDFERGAEAIRREMEGRSRNEAADRQLRDLEKADTPPSPSPSPSPTPTPEREIRGSEK